MTAIDMEPENGASNNPMPLLYIKNASSFVGFHHGAAVIHMKKGRAFVLIVTKGTN
jgi:hypothetical protein